MTDNNPTVHSDNGTASVNFFHDARGYGTIVHDDGEDNDMVRVHRLLAVAEYGFDAATDDVHHGPIEHPIANWRENVRPLNREDHLNHHNRVDDDELVSALQSLADELGHTPTARDMEEHGKYGHVVYSERFGSWNDALEKAGMDQNKLSEYTKSDVIQAIQRLTVELGRPPTFREMDEMGEVSTSPCRRLFGSWSDALEAAEVDSDG